MKSADATGQAPARFGGRVTEGDHAARPGVGRRIAQGAAYGSWGVAAVGAAGLLTAGLLYGQAELARRAIPKAEEPPPRCDGRYGVEFSGPDIRLAVVGDSSAAGYGVQRARDTTGALLASGIAEHFRRPVDLRCTALVGAVSGELARQVARALRHRPDLAVILIGANDVTHRVKVPMSVGYLADAVRVLRRAGAEVVVCTCPDLGTIRPIRRPLRWLARRWSRDLAAAQTVAAVEAGARTVSLGDLLGPRFDSAPDTLFAADRFHPSVEGYVMAASAILPTAVTALSGATAEERPAAAGEGVRSLVQAAIEAADQPGTEVSRAMVAGRERGPAGRWAHLRHRVRQLTVRPRDPATGGSAVPLRVFGSTGAPTTPTE